MNIFVVDLDPEQAARDLPNKLIVKLPVESAQILSTVARQLNHDHPYYKETHKNHPVMKFAKSGAKAWDWLYRHGIELCKEYTRRYGRIHACQSIIEGLAELGPKNIEESIQFVQCMPEKYRVPEEPVRAYRQYCIAEKTYYAKWKNSTKPGWWIIDE